ncbi:hypothetical protein ETU09_05265 [Apibacter muscae]|uniref:Peptide O-xylosyltransferase n=1 Tax=Apibacter muscae TaxID=2509004 RepID=A0A563DF75_9FLAO|nr:beta-1,6-N-acetylglucosaminyltransferase [Apibacter muscae]TWP28727.1 hypothetical protein ETU09_05265 [Apibacter muscae]
MKKIILIHAHKNLDYLNRLIDALDYPAFTIYVNIDKKSNINIDKISSKAILVKKRVSVVWGEYSQVESALNSLRQIVEEQKDFSHVIFISGQDYPIRSNFDIDEFFNNNLSNNFLEYFLVTENNKYHEYLYRVDRKHYPSHRIIERKFHTAYKLLYKFLTKKEYKIKMINNYTCYWGSQWWNLSKEVIEFLLQVADDKKIINFFKTTWCSDEVFFQVALLNSHFKDKIINNNLRYIDWTNCRNSPRNLDSNDFENIINSEALFCRKMEIGLSDSLVNLLEKHRNK